MIFDSLLPFALVSPPRLRWLWLKVFQGWIRYRKCPCQQIPSRSTDNSTSDAWEEQGPIIDFHSPHPAVFVQVGNGELCNFIHSYPNQNNPGVPRSWHHGSQWLPFRPGHLLWIYTSRELQTQDADLQAKRTSQSIWLWSLTTCLMSSA